MVVGMELRHLRYFIAVAEFENITRAAAHLHTSQPSLSRQIRDLEAEMGVELFEHGVKSLRLTEAGRVFLTQAREVVRLAQEAVETARAAAQGQAGEIELGYAPSLSVELLPRILRVFQQRHPGVRMRLHDLSTQEMLHGLRSGMLHAALLLRPSLRAMMDLAFVELERHAVCVALHPAHPLAKAKTLGLESLAQERLVAFSMTEYPEYHAWLAGLFSPLGRVPGIFEEHDSATSLIASVEAGRGLALVSERMNCLTGQRLKIVRVRPAPRPFVLGVATRKEKLPRVVAGFLEAARQAGAVKPAAER